MPSIRSLLLLALPYTSVCAAEPLRHHAARHTDTQPQDFNAIVEALPEESVRSVLTQNLAPKYREGVFEHGKKAIQALHQDNPQLATKLVDAAIREEAEKYDLRRRQNGNTTNVQSTSTVITTTSQTVIVKSSTTSTSKVVQTTTKSTTVPTSNGNGGTTSGNGGGPTTSNGGGSGPTTSASGGGGTTSGGGSGSGTTSGGGGGGTTSGGNGGGTTSGGNGGGAAGSTSSPATQTGVIVSVTKTTTNKAGSTVVKTTSAFATTAPTSAVVQVTTTNAAGSKVTTSKTVPAAIVTTTNAAGKTITSASPLSTVKVAHGSVVGGGNGPAVSVGQAYTTTDKFGNSIVLSGTKAGEVLTTTDAKGRTVVMTYTPGGHRHLSEVVVRTTQLPNGQKSTITSFAVVGGPTGAAAAATTKGKPGLQSQASAGFEVRWAAVGAVLIAGVLGMAAVVM